MSKTTFNPNDWIGAPRQPSPPDPPKEPQERVKRPAPVSSLTSRLQDDLEQLTARIEASRIDITATYDRWRDIGFALTDALGESGRDFYHRISRFYPDYKAEETDKQYDACMRSHGHGITISTLFHYAKQAGISISFAREKPRQEKTSVEVIEVSEGVEVFPEPEEMPTFSQELFGHLPSILDAVARNATSNEDADLLLLGSIVSLSACLPGVSGVYADRTVYPNLFLYVTAPASAGKGRLALCRRLVQPIHNQLREFYHTEMDEYRINKARYEAEKKKHPDAEPPEEPRQQMLIIPANSSSTAVYQILNDNGGNGLLFETEGDTLANVFSSDFGNYSDGLRKCFHHETISYTRRKDKEFVELGGPRLSTVLSGTPRQISALIPDAENGLFSRFIFYYLNFKLEWIDVFARKSDFTLEEIFDDIGYGYLEFYQNLQMLGQMEFSLTPAQQQDFNTYYRSAQEEYHYLFGDDIIASVRRLGLITFRIAMVISTLRTMDTGEMSHHLICDDEDFNSAMTIARVLIKHTGRVFRELSSADLAKPAAERTARQKQFYDALPGAFSTQTFNQLATRLGIPMKTAQRYIKNWCSSGLLRREKHGQYAKPS